MALFGKVFKIVGITFVMSSSACAAPGVIKGGESWPSLNYSQDENKLPPINPIQKPIANGGEEMGAKPSAGERALIESLSKERNNWQARMGGQRQVYKNAKDKVLLATPDKTRNVWMTAQLQLSRLSQVGDDLTDLIKKVDSQPKSPALNKFRSQLTGLRQSLLTYLAKEQVFLASTNPDE